MPRAVALILDGRLRARFRTAGSSPARRKCAVEVSFAQSWDELSRLAAELPPAAAVIDAYCTVGFVQAPRMKDFTQRFPFVPTIAYGRFSNGSPRDLLYLASAGITDAIEEDGGAELPCLLEAVGNPPLPAIFNNILALFPNRYAPAVQRVIQYAVVHAQDRLTPRLLAKKCLCDVSSLNRRLRSANLPSANRIIVWGRLLVAAHLLGRSAMPVDRVARALGYNSDAALRSQVRRYSQMSPRQFRRADSVDRLSNYLLETGNAEIESTPIEGPAPRSSYFIRG
jgi:AraC-like DNA-binding protein